MKEIILFGIPSALLGLLFVHGVFMALRIERKEYRDEWEKNWAESGRCQPPMVLGLMAMVFLLISSAIFTLAAR